jgi:hypothetical protein
MSWNDPTLETMNGSLKRWVDNGLNLLDGNKNYDLEPIVPAFNDFFAKRSGGGASFNAFIYKNGVLINTFFGGIGGSSVMPSFIANMPTFKVTSITDAGTNLFTINFHTYKNRPIEYVAQDPGSDNGYIRLKNGTCGSWTKSSSSVNHTPGISNGSSTGTGDLVIDAHIARGAYAPDSSLINYNITEGPADAFPVELQIYIDNGSVPGELDGNDTFIGSNTENNVNNGPFSNKFIPRTANLLIVAKSATGCLDQTMYVTTPAPTGQTALPVTIEKYEGYLHNGKALISWRVAENEMTRDYVIEKSFDGVLFATAGTVMATKQIGRVSYDYIDPAAISGSMYYRIKFLPAQGGRVEYSKTILVKHGVEASKKLVLQNPVCGTLSGYYTAASNSMHTISVYSMTGTRLYATALMLSKNSNRIELNLQPSFPPATYLLEVSDGKTREVVKFIKQ